MTTQQPPQYSKGRTMDLAHVFLRYFFETEYMHFGYWLPEDPVKVMNLKQAQERYVTKLFEVIPQDVKSILDVGCGSGQMASELVAKGYQVEAVAPPCVMTSAAAEKLKGKAHVHQTRFEDLDVQKKYDLILFSESFQFINLERALEQCQRYSNKYVLIADVFRKDTPDRGPIGGGHKYSEFLQVVDKKGARVIKVVDITHNIAPSFDLEADVLHNFLKPLISVFQRIQAIHNSWVVKFVVWANREKIDKLRAKYLDTHERNGKAFEAYKFYNMVLLGVDKAEQSRSTAA